MCGKKSKLKGNKKNRKKCSKMTAQSLYLKMIASNLQDINLLCRN